MRYKAIRAGSAYEKVVLVSPPTSVGWEDDRAEFYLFDSAKSMRLMKISKRDAMCYFSGVADGMGFAEIPEETFNSEDEFLKWREKSAKKFIKDLTVRTEECAKEPEIDYEMLYRIDPEMSRKTARWYFDLHRQRKRDGNNKIILKFAKRLLDCANAADDNEFKEICETFISEFESK